ncbi:HlyD family secretion protein [Cohaesibacter haloalkalitolerans]|uniref:HlyD family secretion protein n=1 Tax=Cohaesibacter haloalkalitolerans TaxID=1162980 RepID=UPI000E65647D|nr:HlyD family secretion protein [Cohaesibacter haloalkalitolerans]
MNARTPVVAENATEVEGDASNPADKHRIKESAPAVESLKEERPRPARKKRPGRLLVMVSVPLLILLGGLWVWLTSGRFEETDNAYAQQTKIAISADVSGRIQTVSVSENQKVKAGDTLFTLDPEPFQIAVDEAEADLSKARLDVEQLKVSFHTAQASLASAQDSLQVQQELYDRRAILAEKGVTSNSTLDERKLSLLSAKNAVTTAQKQVENARAALGGNPSMPTDEHPLVRTEMAKLELAERNLVKTTIKAPSAGVISKIDNMNVGQFVTAGSSMASLFEADKTWVDANFKETQLEGIEIGMPVEVTFDAYPSTHFNGKVSSISAGTGAEFALIPAQNATGNWVKVVQRVPVRVELDKTQQSDRLRSGLSAVVSVDTGLSAFDKLTAH